jgi:acetyl esterase/lipase
VTTTGRNEPLEQVIAGMRQGGPVFSDDPLQSRAAFEALLATLPVAEDLTFSDAELGGVPALYSASAPGGAGALLYLHGGGYVAGSAMGYRGLAAGLGRAAGVETYAIDYRLAPEHPFPAAVEDAVAAYRELIEQGIDHRRIVIAGDSAGGGLTISTLVSLRDQGVPLPAAAAVFSPWTDLACDSATMESKAAEDPALTPEGVRAMAGHYLAGADYAHPLASPVNADLSGLPPLLIQVGSAEILLADAEKLAERARLAGTPVQLEVWPGMVHVWQAFAFMLPEGLAALDRAGDFLRRAMTVGIA